MLHWMQKLEDDSKWISIISNSEINDESSDVNLEKISCKI